jgi:hypothetical protein
MNAIRLAILKQDVNRICSYMDLLNYDISLDLCRRMCE